MSADPSNGNAVGAVEAEHAVAVARVRVTAAEEIPRRPLRARQRPLPLVAPHVLAHHEDADGRLVEHRRGQILEPVAEPLAADRLEVEHRVGAEVDLADHRDLRGPVRPRPDDQALGAPCLVGGRVLGHAHEVRDRPVDVDVVPATDMERGQVELAVVRAVVEARGRTDRRTAHARAREPSRARSSRATGSRAAGGTGTAARPSPPSGGCAPRALRRRRAPRRCGPVCRAGLRARARARRSGARARHRPRPPIRCGARAAARRRYRTTCPSTPRSRPRAASRRGAAGGRWRRATACSPCTTRRTSRHGRSTTAAPRPTPPCRSHRRPRPPIGSQSPSDSKRPRESWYTTTYPARADVGRRRAQEAALEHVASVRRARHEHRERLVGDRPPHVGVEQHAVAHRDRNAALEDDVLVDERGDCHVHTPRDVLGLCSRA